MVCKKGEKNMPVYCPWHVENPQDVYPLTQILTMGEV